MGGPGRFSDENWTDDNWGSSSATVKETGDHFEVRWTQKIPDGNCETNRLSRPFIRPFIFQKDKDSFVAGLLADDSIVSIEIGTFIKIK